VQLLSNQKYRWWAFAILPQPLAETSWKTKSPLAANQRAFELSGSYFKRAENRCRNFVVYQISEI